MIKIKACPQCKDTGIEIDETMGITGTRYKCQKCGYEGEIVLEKDKKD